MKPNQAHVDALRRLLKVARRYLVPITTRNYSLGEMMRLSKERSDEMREAIEQAEEALEK